MVYGSEDAYMLCTECGNIINVVKRAMPGHVLIVCHNCKSEYKVDVGWDKNTIGRKYWLVKKGMK